MNVNCPVLSFPATFYRGNGSIERLKDVVEKFGSRAFVIGGQRALEATMPLIDSRDLGLDVVDTMWFGGECTYKNADQLISVIRGHSVNFIIGVGGGKSMDTCKLVAEKVGLPLVVIPTIAATCAAVAALSVIYDDKGHYLDFHDLKQAPDVVILDPQIIAKAPARWLSAGLGDTLAKLYEYRVVEKSNPDCSLNMSASHNSQLCFDVIAKYGGEAIQSLENEQPSFALEQVMDAIFIYAGFTSIMGVGNHVAAAHGLYNGFTVIDKTRHFGHGLLVGYGNLCLLALENRSDDEIVSAIELAKACGVPTSLSSIADLTKSELQQVVDAAIDTPDIQDMPFTMTSQDLISAMERVDDLASKIA
ncbi:iron-containing alcohol dehydrogenase family protein [Vibrio sp. WJH972]